MKAESSSGVSGCNCVKLVLELLFSMEGNGVL